MALRLAMALTALLLAGCGGDDEEAATTSDTTAEASSCMSATSDIMTPIGNQVTLDGGRVGNGQLVESEITPGIWFVAVELDAGYEDEGDIATFATANRFGADAVLGRRAREAALRLAGRRRGGGHRGRRSRRRRSGRLRG